MKSTQSKTNNPKSLIQEVWSDAIFNRDICVPFGTPITLRMVDADAEKNSTKLASDTEIECKSQATT